MPIVYVSGNARHSLPRTVAVVLDHHIQFVPDVLGRRLNSRQNVLNDLVFQFLIQHRALPVEITFTLHRWVATSLDVLLAIVTEDRHGHRFRLFSRIRADYNSVVCFFTKHRSPPRGVQG